MRTIDADELKKCVLKWLPEDPCGRQEKEMPFETDICVSMLMEIEEQPTIQPKQRWIPVTERLPEEDDYRPCCGYEDGAVWWRNDMGLMGLGWYYPSTGKWAYYDESDRCEKCVGNVVEWMQLPKREGDAE